MVMPNPRESKYKLPSEPMYMDVTPDMAADWLENRNPTKDNKTNPHETNRRMSQDAVTRYARIMAKKNPDGTSKWKETHQGFAFDTDGWVIDGQQRMRAIVLSGATVPIYIHPNLPRDTFEVVDVGRRRTASQLFHGKYPIVVCGAIRFLSSAADGLYVPFGVRDARSVLLTNDEALSLVRDYGANLEDAASMAVRAASVSGIPASPHAAVLYQAMHSPHAELVEDWMKVLKGAGEGINDPRQRLRNAFTGAKRAQATRSRTMPYALVAKAWNAWADGRSLQALVWRSDEEIPRVKGYVAPQAIQERLKAMKNPE